MTDATANAVALTDHGAMFGAVEFYNDAKKAGVKPIVGMEAYVTRNGRASRKPGDIAHHLVLLARDETGFRNLMRLSSLAYLEGFYYKPRVDHEILSKYSAGPSSPRRSCGAKTWRKRSACASRTIRRCSRIATTTRSRPR